MSTTKPKRYWMGADPGQCDLADRGQGKHDISKNFIDGKTVMGPWAIMCLRCSRVYGAGIGTGLGQYYQKQADGRWLKIDG